MPASQACICLGVSSVYQYASKKKFKDQQHSLDSWKKIFVEHRILPKNN
jgi:hypothetical protein